MSVATRRAMFELIADLDGCDCSDRRRKHRRTPDDEGTCIVVAIKGARHPVPFRDDDLDNESRFGPWPACFSDRD